MADHLHQIFGTEKDKVNCPFYFRVGACRHGERCSRIHNVPILSQTVLIPHMYLNPVAAPMIDAEGRPVEYDKKYLKDHFEEFYEDAFEELSKFGEIEELNVCDNVNEHLLGNVYIKYKHEDDAEKAVRGLQGRYYAGRLLLSEFSPVTDFQSACCKDFEESECSRGGLCNFLHLKPVSRSLRKELFREQRKRNSKREKEKRRSRSKSRSRSRSASRSRSPKRVKGENGDRGSAAAGGASARLRCYNCGTVGHRSSECPRRQG
nr:U2AF1 [Euglena gracilis]|eukprot:EG_transcript_20807